MRKREVRTERCAVRSGASTFPVDGREESWGFSRANRAGDLINGQNAQPEAVVREVQPVADNERSRSRRFPHTADRGRVSERERERVSHLGFKPVKGILAARRGSSRGRIGDAPRERCDQVAPVRWRVSAVDTRRQ